MVNASSRIAAFAARPSHRLPPCARTLAFRALLDTVAVAVAGRNEPAVRIARRYVQADANRGRSRSWIDGTILPPEQAGWLNGIASHVLDYDDVMAPMRGHISVAVVPALLALAPEVEATGKDFAEAYAVGFEVAARMSKVMAASQYAKGWHTTTTLGLLGAVAGCSALLSLSERQTEHALGLAVAQAAGTRQNFGTMAKSFHVGECARAAIRAVKLAQDGFEASADAIDGPSGYAALYGAGEDLSRAFKHMGTDTWEIERTGIEVKKYPCCYAIHLALDAMLSLREEHGLDLAAVESVEVVASANALDALIVRPPTTGLEAKFSMEYTLAAALEDGAVRLSTFDGARVLEPRLMDFLPRIAVREESGPPKPRFARVQLKLRDGRTLERMCDQLRGGAKDSLSEEELIAKVEDCFSFAGHPISGRDFARQVLDLDDRPIADLLLDLKDGEAAASPEP